MWLLVVALLAVPVLGRGWQCTDGPNAVVEVNATDIELQGNPPRFCTDHLSELTLLCTHDDQGAACLVPSWFPTGVVAPLCDYIDGTMMCRVLINYDMYSDLADAEVVATVHTLKTLGAVFFAVLAFIGLVALALSVLLRCAGAVAEAEEPPVEEYVLADFIDVLLKWDASATASARLEAALERGTGLLAVDGARFTHAVLGTGVDATATFALESVDGPHSARLSPTTSARRMLRAGVGAVGTYEAGMSVDVAARVLSVWRGGFTRHFRLGEAHSKA